MAKRNDSENSKKYQKLPEKFTKESHNQWIAEQKEIRKKVANARNEESEAQREKLKEQYFTEAKKLFSEGIRGYDTWCTAMSAIIVLQMQFNEAFGIGHLAKNVFFSTPIGAAVEEIWDSRPVLGSPENNSTPGLDAIFQLTPQNTLDETVIDNSLARSDNKPITAEDKEWFKAGVHAWLEFNGYTLQSDKTWKDQGNQTLDQATFDRLRKDPVTGIPAFFSGKFPIPVAVNDITP